MSLIEKMRLKHRFSDWFRSRATHGTLHIPLNRSVHSIVGLPPPALESERAIAISTAFKPLHDALCAGSGIKKVELYPRQIVLQIDRNAESASIRRHAEQCIAQIAAQQMPSKNELSATIAADTEPALSMPSENSAPTRNAIHPDPPTQRTHQSAEQTGPAKSPLQAPPDAARAQTQKPKSRIGFQIIPTRSEAEQRAIVMDVLADQIAPAIAQHGGKITLVDFKAATAHLRMEGGCQGCGMAQVTLYQGVEQQLRHALPELAGIVDVTDHDQGSSPYYQR